MSEKKSSGANRTRNWSFILYPESAPENWRDIIDEEHIEWIESPLHDKDLNPDGTNKKTHWHILIMYDGVKTFEQVKELTNKLNCTIPQKVASTKGLVRYMAHMDNPEKVQYDKGLIIGHGGVDLVELLKPSSSTRYMLIREMMEYVKENRIVEMKDLLYYAMNERFEDWFPLLCDNSAYIMDALIKSNRHSALKEEKIEYPAGEMPIPLNVDPETGEILD